MFIRPVLTVRPPVTFLRELHTSPSPTGELLLVLVTTVPLIPPVPALRDPVTQRAAAAVLALDLLVTAGHWTAQLVLPRPAVLDSVTDGAGGQTHGVPTLELVRLTRAVQLIAPVLEEVVGLWCLIFAIDLAVTSPVT